MWFNNPIFLCYRARPGDSTQHVYDLRFLTMQERKCLVTRLQEQAWTFRMFLKAMSYWGKIELDKVSRYALEDGIEAFAFWLAKACEEDWNNFVMEYALLG